MEFTPTPQKLDYSNITTESLEELSKCDMSLLSNIYSRCYPNKLNTSHTTVKESLDLALTFERVALFKKIIKDSKSFVSAAKDYSHLVDSLVNNINECKNIIFDSLNRSNSASETIAKTLEFAEKMALTQLITTEIVDKLHVLESHEPADPSAPFDQVIEKLTSKGLKCIESIETAQGMMSNGKKYKALLELVQAKNLELDSICDQLFKSLQDLIRDYSSGSPTAESFFETMYLKDCNLLLNKSFLVVSHKKNYLDYLVQHLTLAKIKRLAHLLSVTRFDSITHVLAFAHELREEGRGFIAVLSLLQESQNPLSTLVDTMANKVMEDNPLARVLEEKLQTFTTSHHLKVLRLLTFYINKYSEEPDESLFFLNVFKNTKCKLMKEFDNQLQIMDSEFIRETVSEIEAGPGLITCDSIDELLIKFKGKILNKIPDTTSG